MKVKGVCGLRVTFYYTWLVGGVHCAPIKLDDGVGFMGGCEPGARAMMVGLWNWADAVGSKRFQQGWYVFVLQ